MYYLQMNGGQVMQIIPEEDPVFPGIPITERYTAEFLDQCITRDNIDGIECGMIYDPDTDTFSDPPKPDDLDGGKASND